MRRRYITKPTLVEIDKVRSLRYTIGAVYDLEVQLNSSIMTLPAWSEMTMRQLQYLFWAGLLHEEENLAVEYIGSILSLTDLPNIVPKVAKAIADSFTMKDEPVEEAVSRGKKPTAREPVDWASFLPTARVSLGFSEEEYWALTPGEFFQYHDRYIWQLEASDFRAATICTTIANVNRSKNRRAFTAKDFLIQRRKQKKKAQTYQEQIELAKSITLAYGGYVSKEVMEGKY